VKTILFIHQSSEMYGSDKVLLLLVQGLSTRGVFHPIVVIPETGPLHSALLASNIEVHVGEVAKISRAIFTPLGLIRLGWKTFQAIRFLDRIVAGRSIGVVHSNTLAVLSGAVWAFFRRKKHLWHVHEIIISPKIVSKCFPYFVDWLSDRVMSNSTLTERWLLTVRPKLASRSVVVFNGLPAVNKPTEAALQAFRHRVGAADGDVVVTLAGRINRMKGQSLLIEAATALKSRNRANAVCFVIVGGPAPGLEHLPAQLKEQAKAAGMADRFNFISFVEDIWPVWFGTDIAVVPSTEPESFGLVAIEAMAAGIPVIAARHGGVLDILVNEETGLLFPPRDASALANAIDRLASDEPLRNRFGHAGASRQRQLFSIEHQVEQTSKVYLEMMQ
jgi:glycosyltransferase involved in cell wall biosynthesis